MHTTSGRTALAVLLGLGLLCAFGAYYHQTSDWLPRGAGPDYASHNDVARFILENRRLPVLPDDADDLYFSVQGGTRATRPPLSYLLAAGLAALIPHDDPRHWITFRKASALLAALTVVLVFFALWAYLHSLITAVAGAALLGLLPQFTFIASYNNDDAGALFSAASLFLAMVLLLRRGPTAAVSAFTGVACGLVVISKPTAWLLVLTAIPFALAYVRPARALARFAATVAALAMLSGGWWILFNVTHYGADDPLQLKVVKRMAEEKARPEAKRLVGYADKGVSIADLLLENRDAFLTKTYTSTIGNLDHMRLQLGRAPYLFYGGLFVAALGFLAWRGGRALVHFAIHARARPGERDLGFELLLLWSLVVQFATFVAANYYNDVQVQGKYLLPAAPAVLLLFFSGLERLGRGLAAVLERYRLDALPLTASWTGHGVVVALGATAVIVHRGALLGYVLPFYQPSFWKPELRALTVEGFHPLDLSPERIAATGDVRELELEQDGLHFETDGIDPRLILDARACEHTGANTLLRARFTAPARGRLKVYWNEGAGFDETHRSYTRHGKGTGEYYVWMGMRGCTNLRVDVDPAAGEYVIHELAVSRVDVALRPETR